VYFNAGEFNKSVADYSKAIRLGAIGHLTFRQRGVASFYAGNWDDAVGDFAKASDLADKDSQVFSDLWNALANQRLGRSIPADVMKRAAAQPRGDWPRPALATLTGALAPDEMLRLINDEKTGDDRQMALTEGYFYLGELYLSRGDKEMARDYFEKARQLQVIIYTEHIAAGFELQRLTR
jgi:lipoprotein NlpI